MACSVALPCALVGTGARPLSGQLDKYAFRDNNGRLSGHTRTAMTHGFRDSTCKRFRVFTTHFFETKHSFQDNTTHKHTHTHAKLSGQQHTHEPLSGQQHYIYSFRDKSAHTAFRTTTLHNTAFRTTAHSAFRTNTNIRPWASKKAQSRDFWTNTHDRLRIRVTVPRGQVVVTSVLHHSSSADSVSEQTLAEKSSNYADNKLPQPQTKTPCTTKKHSPLESLTFLPLISFASDHSIDAIEYHRCLLAFHPSLVQFK